MTVGRSLGGAALIACLLAPIDRAWAGDAVVLIQPATADPPLAAMLLRLRAELESVDFDVLVRDSVAALPQADQEPSTRVVAVVEVRRDDDKRSIDITITNRLSGATLSRRVVASTEGDKAASVIALKSTEVVRASLAELTIVPAVQPKAPVEKPRPAAPPVDPSPPSRVALSVGPAAFALDLPGGTVAFAEALRLSRDLSDRWAIRLSLLAQSPSRSFSTINGTAALQSQMMTLDAVVRIASASSVWLSLDGGAGLHAFEVRGQTASPDNRAVSQNRWMPVFTAGVEGGWSLGPRVALVVDIQGMLSVRRSDIVIVEDEVAHIGPVMLLAGAGLLVRP